MAKFRTTQKGGVWQRLFITLKAAATTISIRHEDQNSRVSTHTLTLTGILSSEELANVKVSMTSVDVTRDCHFMTEERFKHPTPPTKRNRNQKAWSSEENLHFIAESSPLDGVKCRIRFRRQTSLGKG